ncbi:MAG: Lrp/AsnC family transcriptional regulator [Verrucomicrobiae bacterium]|nr:Lrp/AsnC family transcriptional regulator [Verrucomicrobiae bacterium]
MVLETRIRPVLGSYMRQLDDQEKLIARELIRDPRQSDNAIAEKTKIPGRTVSRKRQRMEQENILSYFTALGVLPNGDGRSATRHQYIIKFRLGITAERLVNEIKSEPNVKTIFTELIYESHIAEIDGHISLVMVIEGKNDAEIVESFQGKIIPSLLKNHGDNSIQEISTIRLLAPIRIKHNYIPMVNMKDGVIKRDWPDDGIFVA